MERRGIECIQQDQKMGQLSSSLDLSYIHTCRYLPVTILAIWKSHLNFESEIPITRDTEHGTPSPNSQPP